MAKDIKDRRMRLNSRFPYKGKTALVTWVSNGHFMFVLEGEKPKHLMTENGGEKQYGKWSTQPIGKWASHATA